MATVEELANSVFYLISQLLKEPANTQSLNNVEEFLCKWIPTFLTNSERATLQQYRNQTTTEIFSVKLFHAMVSSGAFRYLDGIPFRSPVPEKQLSKSYKINDPDIF